MSLEERVIRRLNQELGSDIENLHKSKDLVEKFNIDLDNIEIKVKSLSLG